MNVLFVEDDPMNRRVVKDMLDVAGAVMVGAESAEIGLGILDQQNFDIVLMDLRMPGMDGMTAIGHIRRRADAKAQIPIIVVTADIAVNLRDDCIRGGADEVLFKPVAMESLFDAIGRLMARKISCDGLIG